MKDSVDPIHFTYIYTTTDAREVNAILNNGTRHIVSDLSIKAGENVQTGLGLKFNPASYLEFNERLFKPKERRSIVRMLREDGQFVAVNKGNRVKQYAADWEIVQEGFSQLPNAATKNGFSPLPDLALLDINRGDVI